MTSRPVVAAASSRSAAAGASTEKHEGAGFGPDRIERGRELIRVGDTLGPQRELHAGASPERPDIAHAHFRTGQRAAVDPIGFRADVDRMDAPARVADILGEIEIAEREDGPVFGRRCRAEQ